MEMKSGGNRAMEMTVGAKPAAGFPPTSEIAARFPHSHRPDDCYMLIKTYFRKEPSSLPAPSPLRLILRLEKTALKALKARRQRPETPSAVDERLTADVSGRCTANSHRDKKMRRCYAAFMLRMLFEQSQLSTADHFPAVAPAVSKVMAVSFPPKSISLMLRALPASFRTT